MYDMLMMKLNQYYYEKNINYIKSIFSDIMKNGPHLHSKHEYYMVEDATPYQPIYSTEHRIRTT